MDKEVVPRQKQKQNVICLADSWLVALDQVLLFLRPQANMELQLLRLVQQRRSSRLTLHKVFSLGLVIPG